MDEKKMVLKCESEIAPPDVLAVDDEKMVLQDPGSPGPAVLEVDNEKMVLENENCKTKFNMKIMCVEDLMLNRAEAK
eukprot:8799465-Karenia_brevis.AAC.1